MFRKNGGRVAFCGMMTALALVFLLLTVVPVTQISLAVLAGMVGVPVVIECGKRYGLVHYAAVAVLSVMLVPALEGKALYIAFFGYYPVLKAWLEQRCLPRAAEYAVKVAAFSGAMVAAYWLMLRFFGLEADAFAIGGVPLPWLFLVLGIGVFLLYDWCLTRLIGRYMISWRVVLRRLFRF